MSHNRRVLVYEFISAGAASGNGAEEDADLLAQGRAMRDAMLADLCELPEWQVSCAGSDSAPLPGWASAVEELRPLGDEAPQDFLRRLAADFDRVWVVAPESGGILATLCEAVGPERWLGCAAAAIRVASSKKATRRRLSAFGIRVPGGMDFAQSPHTAWVVKPDDGVGAIDIRLHGEQQEAWRDLAWRLGCGRSATMEAWVEGQAMSLSVLAADGHAEVLGLNRQRVEIEHDGSVRYLGVDHLISGPDATLDELAGAVCSAIPGLAGYFGIDLVVRQDRPPVVIEVNPRLTCAYVGLSKRLDRNLAGEMLTHADQQGRQAFAPETRLAVG